MIERPSSIVTDMRFRTIRAFYSILMIGLAVGCRGGDESGEPIQIDGSSTVYRISMAAQEAYRKQKPEVLVIVDEHGTGGGFARYLQNEVDIVDASRPAKPGEESKARAQGIEWTRFTVGYDGITVVVNPKNDFVKSLSVQQLKALWAPDSRVKTWKDLDSSWPDRKIVFYSPDDDSGTFDFFTEATVGKTGAQRKDVQASSDDNLLVNGVAGDRDAIGYFGYAYYKANEKRVRSVAIQNGPDAPAVAPASETINNKTYAPLSRPLYIYVKSSALRRRPEVAEFVSFYLANVKELAEAGGYVAPTADDRKENERKTPKTAAK